MLGLKYELEQFPDYCRKNGGLLGGLKVLVFNLRWNLGYWIGPFNHACDNSDCGLFAARGESDGGDLHVHMTVDGQEISQAVIGGFKESGGAATR